MPDTTQRRRNQRKQIQVHDKGIPRDEERILATVPSQTGVERYAGDGPSPEAYRQALKVMLASPEIESRLNYITASIIVTIFGGWLASRMILSRAFMFFVDLTLFIVSLALAGLLIGIMLGENILPGGMVPVLFFAATGIVLLIVGCLLGSMMRTATSHSRRRRAETFSQSGMVISPLEQRSMVRARENDRRPWQR